MADLVQQEPNLAPIVVDCVQRGRVWHKSRLGIPTASCFDKILTPATRKLSTQSDGYRSELLAEWLTGVPHGIEAQAFMDRGTRYEPHGVRWYAMERDIDVKPVGLVLRGDRMVAASPDGLVGDDGGLEVKCPGAKGHVVNLLLGMKGDYFAQCQGALYITGRKWWDLMSYHPEMPPVVHRYERDEAYIDALHGALSQFLDRLRFERKFLLDRGCVPATTLNMPATALVVLPGDEEPF